MVAELEEALEQLAETGWAAEVLDDQWRIVWVSDALRAVLGDPDDDALGIGRPVLEARECGAWPIVSRERYLDVVGRLAPAILADAAEHVGDVPDDVRRVLDDAEPRTAPPVWTTELDFAEPDMPRVRIRYIAARLQDRDGNRIGTAGFYGPNLAAPVLALVVRGDREMFERMAALLEPARRPAAILFADLEASGELSRHLPTAAYFELVREVRTEIDEVVIARKGLVGKHAGDGVTAFFIAEQIGSESGAARAAIEAGRAIRKAATSAAEGLAERGLPVNPDDVLTNVGMHWGSGLYVGQVVTGGRLEVTALGDEVNEAARIE